MDEKDYLMRQVKNYGKALRAILSDDSAEEILNFGDREEQVVKLPDEESCAKEAEKS